LISGISIAVIFFYQAVITPLENITDMTMNQATDFWLTEGSFISLYIDDEKLTDYEITENEDIYLIHYQSGADTYVLQLDVINLDDEDQSFGYHISEKAPNSTYTFDNYLNYADITLTETGNYRLRLVSYDDLPGTFGYAFSDFDTATNKLMISGLGIGIGVGGAVASLITISIFRNKSRKKQEKIVLESEVTTKK